MKLWLAADFCLYRIGDENLNKKVTISALVEAYEMLTKQYTNMEEMLEVLKKQKFYILDLKLSKERLELELFLQKQEKDMGEQIAFLRSMRLALEQIMICYEKGEIVICDKLEGYKKEYPDVKVKELKSSALKEMLLSLGV